MREKIKNLSDIVSIVAEAKAQGQKIVHCHGVFDLLHPGHIRHLREARQQGDCLIVSVTPDRFVNKGPGRPAFSEQLRLEQLASLMWVDYVVLNESPDAQLPIQKISPHLYVKGIEYADHAADVTGKISQEVAAVEKVGGKIHYTDDIVFSSSTLLNRFFDSDAVRIAPFIELLKSSYSLAEIQSKIEALSSLKVLVVGDAILDEYQYVHPLGQSGKGVHLTARLLEKETFLGGALILANHLASFAGEVTLLSALGSCEQTPWIKQMLAPKITPLFVHFDHFPTLTKKRYVLKDGQTITKLFETYSSNDSLLDRTQTDQVLSVLKSSVSQFDLVLVCDFGNGFTNPAIIEALCALPTFLAVNTQTNSGNRGFHVVTQYHRADFISLNEPELRLAAHDRYSRLDTVLEDIALILKCPQISVTRGVEGVCFYQQGKEPIFIPALTMQAMDRVGAGDSYFALAALCAAKGYDPLLTGFIGSVAAAMAVQIIGNKEAIDRVALNKYLMRLLK